MNTKAQIVLGGLALGFSLSGLPAVAEDVSQTIARHGASGALVRIVHQAVATDTRYVWEYCRAADEENRDIQVHVGTGFAHAYKRFVAEGRMREADEITDIACECERTVEQILSSFSAGIEQPLGETCSPVRIGGYAYSVPGLFKPDTTGGGDGMSRN